MHLQKSRFAKGLLVTRATMFRGSRTRTSKNSFHPAAPGPSPQAARPGDLPAHFAPNDAKSRENDDAGRVVAQEHGPNCDKVGALSSSNQIAPTCRLVQP